MALAATKGEYALIGAPSDKEAIGAAWVFLRTGTTWAQQGAKLTAKSPEETGAGSFGYSVAVSGEGKDALMGAPGDNERIGAAWVFTRSGDTWTQQGTKLVAKAGEEIGGGEFGKSVALSAKEVETNKLYALIGGPKESSSPGVGAAWVFLRTTTTWAQQGAKLTGSGEAGAGEFGNSVALSAEGKDALLGGPMDNGEVGAAWVSHAHGHRMETAGRKAHRKGLGRDRSGRIPEQRQVRLQRGGLLRRQHRADRGSGGCSAASAPRGCSPARARPGPSRA